MPHAIQSNDDASRTGLYVGIGVATLGVAGAIVAHKTGAYKKAARALGLDAESRAARAAKKEEAYARNEARKVFNEKFGTNVSGLSYEDKLKYMNQLDNDADKDLFRKATFGDDDWRRYKEQFEQKVVDSRGASVNATDEGQKIAERLKQTETGRQVNDLRDRLNRQREAQAKMSSTLALPPASAASREAYIRQQRAAQTAANGPDPNEVMRAHQAYQAEQAEAQRIREHNMRLRDAQLRSGVSIDPKTGLARQPIGMDSYVPQKMSRKQRRALNKAADLEIEQNRRRAAEEEAVFRRRFTDPAIDAQLRNEQLYSTVDV